MPGKFILEESSLFLDFMSSDRIPFPQSLQIELTSCCNLRCVMCPKTLGVSRTEPNKEMNRETLDYLISSVLPYVERIDIVGDGEPLLAMDLLLYLLENAEIFRVPVTICSNGQLLDKEVCQRLIDLNLEDINVSIDAANAETYSKIRDADFSQLIHNLETLKQLKKDSGRDTPHLHLSMVAMEDNIHELPMLLDLAKNLNADSLTIQAMGEVTDEMKGKSAFLNHRDLTEEILYKCLIEAEASGFPLKIWPPKLFDVMGNSEDLGAFLSGDAPPPGDSAEWKKDCAFLWKSPFITTNGDVRPCCAELPPLGNLGKSTFQEIWYSKAARALRKNLLTGDLPHACLKCPGMGWRKIYKTKSSIHAPDEIFDAFPGWYGVELEERHFRWTQKRALLYLNHTPAEKFLLLQMRKAASPEAPSSGMITINNEEPMPFKLTTTNWETLEFPLSTSNDDEIFQVEFNLSHSIRPSEIDPNSHDSRLLGVKLTRAWVEDWPQKVVFGHQLVLLGYEIVPETWNLDGDALIRTFWRSLDVTHLNVKAFVHFSREGDNGVVTSPIRRKLGIGRKDFFQADHLLLSKGQPSSNWIPGIFIAHEHRFPVPDNLNAGHYRIEIGLYGEGYPKDRIPIVRSDRPNQDNSALLGTVLISDNLVK